MRNIAAAAGIIVVTRPVEMSGDHFHRIIAAGSQMIEYRTLADAHRIESHDVDLYERRVSLDEALPEVMGRVEAVWTVRCPIRLMQRSGTKSMSDERLGHFDLALRDESPLILDRPQVSPKISEYG